MMGSKAFVGRGPIFLPGRFHQFFITLAGFSPGRGLQRHATLAHALAGVLAGMGATAALPLAIIRRVTSVLLGDGAGTGSGAGVLLVGAFALTGVQTAANVVVAEQRIRFGRRGGKQAR